MTAQRIAGFIDSITNDRVYGWVWDQQEPERRLNVEIYLEDRCLGSVTADLPRPDLRMNGIGDGRYAFEFVLDGVEIDPLLVRAVIRPFPDEEPIEVAKSRNALSPELLDTGKALFRLIELFEILHSNQIAITRSVPASIGDLRNAVRQDSGRDIVPRLVGLAEVASTEFSSLHKRLSDLEVFVSRFDTTMRSIDQKADRLARRGEDTVLRGMVGVLLALTLVLTVFAGIAAFGG